MLSVWRSSSRRVERLGTSKETSEKKTNSSREVSRYYSSSSRAVTIVGRYLPTYLVVK